MKILKEYDALRERAAQIIEEQKKNLTSIDFEEVRQLLEDLANMQVYEIYADDDIDHELAEHMRELAAEQYEEEGKIEVDPDALISAGAGYDEGCFVQGWLWVYFPDDEGE